MSVSIALSEAPQELLDQDKWAELRSFASSNLIALTYINAPYPDPDHPEDFFWRRDGSFDDARRCYEIGRELLDQSRRLLIEGKLVAFGKGPDGQRVKIKPIEWPNLWPMFATNRATGPNQSFDDVKILETASAKMLRGCISWLRAQSPAALNQKKPILLHRAKLHFNKGLSHAVFNAAYLTVLGRSRGRPRK
jgi:hypothetical protein